MMPLTTGESNFTSVEPYTKSRLIALPFADILRNYKVISEGLVTDNPLKFLYPNIPMWLICNADDDDDEG
jgi:signal transducer and activator of transcription 4